MRKEENVWEVICSSAVHALQDQVMASLWSLTEVH